MVSNFTLASFRRDRKKIDKERIGKKNSLALKQVYKDASQVQSVSVGVRFTTITWIKQVLAQTAYVYIFWKSAILYKSKNKNNNNKKQTLKTDCEPREPKATPNTTDAVKF